MPIQPTETTAVCIAGAAGRMGRQIARAVEAATDLELAALLVEPGEPGAGRPLPELPGGPAASVQPAAVLARGRVLVDFTAPPATAALVELAAAAGCPFVSGSTALDGAAAAALAGAARTIPVLHAANMSRGIELLGRLVAAATRRLGPDYDVEIVERHHRRKADAPSGTALRLAEQVAAARQQAATALQHGRQGDGLARAAGEIGMHALRGGDWVGEHTVIFSGPGETLELHHRAESRAVFVAGTLACIRFVAGAPPGRYGMHDVLGA